MVHIKIDHCILVFSICLSLSLPLIYVNTPEAEDSLHSETALDQRDAENSGVGMAYLGNEETGISADIEGILKEQSEGSTFYEPLFYSSYQVAKGDMIGIIAQSYGLNQDTILSVNGIKNSRLLQIGQYLRIPNQDGILYTFAMGDTLTAVAEKHQVDLKALKTINRIESIEPERGDKIFIPGAKLSDVAVQEINGDLFIWPVNGYVTSPYGYRNSPFTGVRQFHAGIDIGAYQGTPIKAAMAGRVSAVGYDVNSGNYVIVSHHSGYRTFYGHLDVIRTSVGAYVKTGERIGNVGSTGLSTGSHLHFAVIKNGVTVNPRLLMK